MSKYTPSQLKAIEYEGKEMFVSASAGSGKTTVLIDRIVRLILSKKVGIDGILAVTFTNAAAKNMKDKLTKKLAESITEENCEYIKEQISLIPMASVSTIDSFCVDLIKTYFYKVGLEAGFGVVDENDAKRLSDVAINDLFERLYEEENEDFISLVEIYSKKRRDTNLKNTVKEIYDKIITEENPQGILDKSLYNYTADGVKIIENELKDYYVYKIKSVLDKFEANLIEVERNNLKKTAEYCYGFVENVKNVLCKSDGRAFIQAVNEYVIPRFSGETKCDELQTVVRETAKDLKGLITKYLNEIKAYADTCLNVDDDTQTQNYEVCRKLFWLVGKYKDEFTAVKKRENVVDFCDLEQMAIEILNDEEIRKEISGRYSYVFADECQDLNGVQYALLKKIGDGKTFMVGDVKQCIYEFRGSSPEIFTRLIDEAKAKNPDTVVFLDENFRSSDKVLDTVNSVFKRNMTKAHGGYDYALNPMMRGGIYPENCGEAYIETYQKTEKQQDFTPSGVYDLKKHLELIKDKQVNAEGVAVAELVRSEIGKPYYDIELKKERPVTYSDIAILTRSNTERASGVLDTLYLYGIPVSAVSKQSITTYPEIALMKNVLFLIDRFNRDIPLVAVLKSPVGNFTENELVEVRYAYKEEKSFCDCVEKYVAEKDDEISAKLKKFIDYLDGLRLIAEYENAGTVLSRVVEECGLDVYYLKQPFGNEKLRRINRFITECSAGDASVKQFLSKLEYIEENLTDNEISGDNTVKFMTMHASKGLEFPVVIVISTDSKFSNQDKKGEFFFDREYGIAIKNYDLKTRTVTKITPPRFLIEKRMDESRETEEMRIFYVALTRAKYRLHIISGSDVSDDEKPKINAYVDLLKTCDAETVEFQPPEDDTDSSQGDGLRDFIVGERNEKLIEKIYSNITFKYGYEEDVSLPMKRSVSALVKKTEDVFYERDNLFGESNTLTGNAYHKALELIDFYGDFEKEYERIITSGLLTDEYKNVLDKEKLHQILKLPVFELVDGYKLYKEQPFTFNISANKIMEVCTGENVLIQGIIDLLAIKDGQAVIVDYKYSTIKSDSDLLDKYEKQLKLYASAVKNVLGLNVKAYLININSLRCVEVENLGL